MKIKNVYRLSKLLVKINSTHNREPFDYTCSNSGISAGTTLVFLDFEK
jgi:hypothetical protein